MRQVFTALRTKVHSEDVAIRLGAFLEFVQWVVGVGLGHWAGLCYGLVWDGEGCQALVRSQGRPAIHVAAADKESCNFVFRMVIFWVPAFLMCSW